MADTTARVLRLLTLLQAHRSWSGQELIDRLEVSERTLRRDVERLRQLGYPVRATTGRFGGYQLEAGANMPPLLLDDEEAVAIAIGLRTAAGGTVTGIEETSVRALAKLEQVLPPRIRRRVNMLQSMIVPMTRPWVTVDAELLTTFAQACRDQERVRFYYRSRSDEMTERNVEPHQLVSLGQRWYLLAFDRDRDDWRTFRLDRVDSPRLTRFRFEPRPIPGGDAGDYVLRAMQARPMRYQVSVTVASPAFVIESKLRPGEGTVEIVDDARCLLRTQGDSLEWLAFMLLWFGVDFEVHEPPELVDHISAVASRLERSAARRSP
jgi:predicted DNA-binding transcriptional regulator YafY